MDPTNLKHWLSQNKTIVAFTTKKNHLSHHYDDHNNYRYGNQPQESHDNVHTTSGSPSISYRYGILKELGTIEVTTGEKGYSLKVKPLHVYYAFTALTQPLDVVFQWH